MKIFSVNYCLPSLPFPLPSFCFNSPLFKAWSCRLTTWNHATHLFQQQHFIQDCWQVWRLQLPVTSLKTQHSTRTRYKQRGNFTCLLKKVLPAPCFNCAVSERRTLAMFFNTTLFSCTSTGQSSALTDELERADLHPANSKIHKISV